MGSSFGRGRRRRGPFQALVPVRVVVVVVVVDHGFARSRVHAFMRSRVHAFTRSFSPRPAPVNSPVWLTNYRLVLVPSEPTPQFQAIELPLLYIHDFDVVQPIFGANYLHGNCHTEAPSTAGRTTGRTAVPPGLAWRVDFANGGMSTMVPLFYQTVDFVRRVARDAGGADDVREGRGVRVTRPDFVVDAVVDPNDPTVVYVVAEDDGGIEDEARKECAFDTLWAKKNV